MQSKKVENLPRLSTYHTNLKIDEDRDVSAQFRLTGQVKKTYGSPSEFPPNRFHPTDKQNLFMYKDAPTGLEVPDEEYAAFYGEENPASLVQNPY